MTDNQGVDMIQYKTCNKCLQHKPLTEYYRRSKNSDKYLAVCKDCKDAYMKVYLKKKAKPKAELPLRICLSCNLSYRPLTTWQKTCSYQCGYRYQNSFNKPPINQGKCARCGKSLIHKRNKAIYCSKSCKSMDHNFKYQKGLSKRITIARRQEIIDRDSHTCYICKKVCLGKELEIDHIIPKSRGGVSSAENLSVSCFSCNRSKGSKIGIEQLVRLSELRAFYDN